MAQSWTKAKLKTYAAAYKREGSIRKMAAAWDISIGTSQRMRRTAQNAGLLPVKHQDQTPETVKARGKVKAKHTPAVGRTTETKRYLFTCAQNDTRVFDKGWENLLEFASKIDAQIIVAKSVYDTGSHSSIATKTRTGRRGRIADFVWNDAFTPYLHDERLQLAPGLVWAGELNVLPTTENPLSSLESYTGRSSMVMPHARVAMRSVHSPKGEAAKLMYTTGTMTQRNYIQRKAGQKAEFHHSYGALLVEVMPNGKWFCRQVNMASDGTFQDMDRVMRDGIFSIGHRVEAISWGDIHQIRISGMVENLGWNGTGSMFSVLRPKYQFIHDLIDFWSRNHHEMKDLHKFFEKFVSGVEDVDLEVAEAMRFLKTILHRDTETVVVDSNHDNALTRWLINEDGRKDPVNAIFWLRANLAKYEAMERQEHGFHMLEDLYTDRQGPHDLANGRLRFLREDESFIINKNAAGGIEMGMHGHLGAGGGRGNHQQFRKMGRKSNTGHEHGAGIYDGNYVNGTSSQLDLGYNKGLSNWTHSHTVTYPLANGGKRAIYTMFDNDWRAS